MRIVWLRINTNNNATETERSVVYHIMQFRGEIKQERTGDVLERFLHLLLASLAVNGHPKHHNL
jgi:hypothetical protein